MPHALSPETLLIPGGYMPEAKLLENLKYLFNPRTVAVIGASDNPNKLGAHVMKSLTQGGFEGRILPVNPSAKTIMGIEAMGSVVDSSIPIDLAVVVVPAQFVPAVFEQCVSKNVRGIVLITAGFKEIDDPQGAKLQEKVRRLATKAAIPVIGPNTFGMINLNRNLNASFTPQFSLLQKGKLTLVSQSGGMSHLLAFMAMKQEVGFSKVVGLGNRLNVDFPDMVSYLMEDPDTEVIMLYLEGLDQPRKLLEAASRGRGKKPIIAYKTGRAESGDRASLSHTGSLAGNHDIYRGGFRQAGILCLDSSEALLDTARAMLMCPPPKGRKVAILSGQAGPAMAAGDFCEANGLEIAAFDSGTQKVINELLPPLALRTNPVDLGPAWYDARAIAGIVGAVMEDKNVDAILLLMMFASANRGAIASVSDLALRWKQQKPLITCLAAPQGIWEKQVKELEQSGALTNLPTPERAAQALVNLWEYRKIMEK